MLVHHAVQDARRGRILFYYVPVIFFKKCNSFAAFGAGTISFYLLHDHKGCLSGLNRRFHHPLFPFISLFLFGWILLLLITHYLALNVTHIILPRKLRWWKRWYLRATVIAPCSKHVFRWIVILTHCISLLRAFLLLLHVCYLKLLIWILGLIIWDA